MPGMKTLVLAAASVAALSAPAAAQVACSDQVRVINALIERDLVEVVDETSGDRPRTTGTEKAANWSAEEASESMAAEPEASVRKAALGTASGTVALGEVRENDPMVLTMADGSTIRLTDDEEEALEEVVEENWFGSAPDIDTARTFLDSAVEMAEMGDEEACLASIADAREALEMRDSDLPSIDTIIQRQ